MLNINPTNLPQPIVFVNSQNRLPIAYILLSKDNHFEGKYLMENCYKSKLVDLFKICRSSLYFPNLYLTIMITCDRHIKKTSPLDP